MPKKQLVNWITLFAYRSKVLDISTTLYLLTFLFYFLTRAICTPEDTSLTYIYRWYTRNICICTYGVCRITLVNSYVNTCRRSFHHSLNFAPILFHRYFFNSMVSIERNCQWQYVYVHTRTVNRDRYLCYPFSCIRRKKDGDEIAKNWWKSHNKPKVNNHNCQVTVCCELHTT